MIVSVLDVIQVNKLWVHVMLTIILAIAAALSIRYTTGVNALNTTFCGLFLLCFTILILRLLWRMVVMRRRKKSRNKSREKSRKKSREKSRKKSGDD